jgi:Lrp/AsnC family transcriptional regulator, leucine-responsive regulatory protein
MIMKLNDVHVHILKSLRRDARRSFTRMGASADVPVTTVFDNYGRLLNDGFIKKHTSLVDFRKLGFNYRNFVFVKSRDKQALINFLGQHPNVNSIYRISGYDYMVDVVFSGMKEFYEFLDELNKVGISQIETHDVIDNIKSEAFFSQPEKISK